MVGLIAIVNYGVGNLRSVERALAEVGANPVLSSDPDLLARASGLVLPGVGAFAHALKSLEASNLGRAVVDLAHRGTPVLGVCLGYQLLFEESSEHGRNRGLGLLRGHVSEIQNSPRLPVIGWCRLHQEADSPLWAGVAQDSYFYFVHSFTPQASPDVLASTGHARVAAAGRGAVMGTQFHPELSGRDGLLIYRNFVDLCGAG